MAFVPSVLALACSFTTGSDGQMKQEVIKAGSGHHDLTLHRSWNA